MGSRIQNLASRIQNLAAFAEDLDLVGGLLQLVQLLQRRFLFLQCLVVGRLNLLKGLDGGLERLGILGCGS